ncbi:MAG: hypothetical protein KAS71_04420 [Bacteroidales bacterium]|nr:hypothetical protein [Bacteroidales bacterium]
MDPAKFKDIIFTKNLSQINNTDLDDLISEFPYFDILRLLDLMKVKLNDPEKYSETLSQSAIYFSDKKRLHKLLYTDLRKTLIKDYGEANKTLELDSEDEANQLIEHDENELLDFSYSPKKDKNDVAIKKTHQNNIHESEKKVSLIDRFLIEEPGPIRADKETSLTGDVSKASVMESENLLTDTLAKIYVKQGLYNKAIFAYEKLSLKYPEKSVYFASQIKEIKELINKK